MLQQPLDIALTFDDVLLVPAASDVLPAETDLRTRVSASIFMGIPLLSSAMDTVTEATLALEMSRLGGIGVIHKNLSIQAQAAEVARVKAAVLSGPATGPPGVPCLDDLGRPRVAAAVGVGSDSAMRVDALLAAGADLLCVDTAHGHSSRVLDAVREIKKRHPNAQLVVGNIATAAAARDLIDAGADCLKVGIGPGSICTTRVVAGVGVPQITAIAEVARVAGQAGVPVIADGGIKLSGDIAKAVAAGADAVMIGSLLAGTDESPGDVIVAQGRKYKVYRGMGSVEAMQAGSADRYFQDRPDARAGMAGVEKGSDVGDIDDASGGNIPQSPLGEGGKLVPEGIVGRVPYKGPLASVVYQLVGGLRAAMGYTGCATIDIMKGRAQFVRISAAGLRESHVHDVDMISASPNYSIKPQ